MNRRHTRPFQTGPGRCYGVVAACLAALLLKACAVPPAPQTDGPPAFNPAGFSGGTIYDVLPGQSRLLITVYRDGPMAKMGHNHVISAGRIEGAVYRHKDPAQSGVVLTIPVRSLEVDNPGLRRADPETFDSEPTEADVAGTRRNMLGPALLDADNHREIAIRSVSINGTGPEYEAVLRFGVRDHHSDIRVPLRVESGDRHLTISGSTAIKQTGLGLEPYSVMMGALRVRDEMDIAFEIHAAPRR